MEMAKAGAKVPIETGSPVAGLVALRSTPSPPEGIWVSQPKTRLVPALVKSVTFTKNVETYSKAMRTGGTRSTMRAMTP